MRIKYDCLLAKPIAGDRQRGRMVGIAADEHKRISFVFVCIGSHLDGKV